jgi:wobble nucleotide-excising tRNase
MAFANGVWNGNLPDLEVFDEAFIAGNVYSGSQVDHSHKRNLHRFVVGAQGVQLAQQVDGLDTENRKKAAEITEKEREIRQHIVGSMGVSEFLDLDSPTEGAIAAKESEITALDAAERIVKKSTLKPVSLPEIPMTALKELLVATVEGVSREAAQRVQDHIVRCMDGQGENWIESGLDYVEASNCPFCGQSIVGNDLVEAYQLYFDEAYGDHKQRIEGFSQTIRRLLSEDRILEVQESIASNDELSEFWKGQVDAQYPEVDFETMIKRPWQDLRARLRRALDQKAAAPLEESQPDEALEAVFRAYVSRSQASVDGYNKTVEMVNELIEEKKEETEAGDLVQARKELERLKNQRTRHSPEVAQLSQEYGDLCKEKEDLETAKANAKSDLDDYADKIIEDYGPSLNEHLFACGTGFRIVELDRDYLGGKPRADYCIEIDGEHVDLGSADTPVEQPSFKNTLSSGDKSALAFAFFITRLKQDPDLEDKMVIIDDPASSLDAHRRSYTCYQIAWLCRHCRQVIVLTHSARLARDICDSAKDISTRTLWIKRDGDYSAIDNLDIFEKTQGEYFKNYFDIADYLDEGPRDDTHMRSVARCIRLVLEGYLRVCFPREFGAREQLGNFIRRVGEAGKGDVLYSLKPRIADISQINSYSSKYHHDQNPHANSEPISDGELNAWAARILNFVGSI